MGRKNKYPVEIIYDIQSLPQHNNLDFETILDLAKKQGLLLWDSSTGGKEPKVVNRDLDITLIDNNEEYYEEDETMVEHTMGRRPRPIQFTRGERGTSNT